MIRKIPSFSDIFTAILEAMKMQSVVTAPHAGKVARVAVEINDSISPGDLIVRIDK